MWRGMGIALGAAAVVALAALGLWLMRGPIAMALAERAYARAFAMDPLGELPDGLSVGLFLIDATGRIVHANAAGSGMLGAGDLLRSSGGRLVAGDARVEQSFVDLVRVECPCTVRSVVAYLRARLEGGGVREGAETASFEHVKPRGKPEPELGVHVAAIMGGARIELQKVTVAPAASLPDEPARWQHVGLTPRGKVIDPTHLD